MPAVNTYLPADLYRRWRREAPETRLAPLLQEMLTQHLDDLAEKRRAVAQEADVEADRYRRGRYESSSTRVVDGEE